MPDHANLRPQRLPADEWSRWWGLRFRMRERLSRSLVVVPSLYIVGAVLLAELMPLVEGNRDVLDLSIDVETARTMLSAVTSGMIAFTGLVVSIAIVVVQFGASQYTPRLVNLFRRDPRVKHSLGIFIAPAIFSLISLRRIGEHGSTEVPGLTLAINTLLLVAAVLAFFLLVGGLLDLLRPRRVIGRVVLQAQDAIEHAYPAALEPVAQVDIPAFTDTAATIRHAGTPGVLSALDRGSLLRAARAADVTVEVLVPVGAYIAHGAPVFAIHGQGTVASDELRRAAILAEERTIAQDPAFAIRTIVDLALRALSPAVNDPTTAVQALDGIGSLLSELAKRDLSGRGSVTDMHGRLRLVYPTPTWTDLLDLALTEIRHYGASAPQIPRRMSALIDDLMAASEDVRRPALLEQRARLDASVAQCFGDPAERAHALTADRLGIGSC